MQEAAPILRAVFPEFTDDEIMLADAEISRFLGLLLDDYMKEKRRREPGTLDGISSCDNLNGT